MPGPNPRVRGCPALTLTPKNPRPLVGMANLVSPVRVSVTLSKLRFLRILPSQSDHANRTGQYAKSARQINASSDT